MIALPTLTGVTNSVYVGINNTLWTRKVSNTTILQKSTDGGDSWVDVYTFVGTVGAVIEFDNGTILVSTDTNDVFDDPPAEWWRSTNGGSTFTKVLTYTNGGVRPWSFDYRGSVVYVSEYGDYPSSKVYKSTDRGATWTTVFDHPRAPANPTTLHLHAVHIDASDVNRVWLSVGDGKPSKGLWYSSDAGSNWTEFDTNKQPTWIMTSGDWVLFLQDLEGLIHRTSITSVLAGTEVLLPVYSAMDDTGATLGKLSFYAGRVCSNGLMFAGGVAYGENNIAKNNLDAVLLVSTDSGASWKIVNTYARKATVSSGPSYISRETSDGLVYIKTNNPETVEILDTNNPDLLTLPQTYFPNRSFLTIKRG